MIFAVKKINFNKNCLNFGRQNSTVFSNFFKRFSTIPSISAQTQFIQDINNELEVIRKEGTYKKERIITSKQEMEIHVEGHSCSLINFCANNYLGLSAHSELIQAGKDCLDNFGAGLSSVRFICGTQSVHRKLEHQISKFHGREDTILYGSCFDANAGLFKVITNNEDAIISDELNHASIIDGIMLTKAHRFRYKHMDMKDLELQLFHAKDCRRRIIVTDGVFSMDGDIAPLSDIIKLAKRNKALLIVDDCHATGFVGATGRGTEEAFGLLNSVDIINSTLGKALGGAMGGYTTGSRQLIELLRQRSRPSLFSNSLAPGAVGPALKALELLSKDNKFVTKLRSSVAHFRSEMKNAGFSVLGNEEHPICPILVGDARLASEMADAMLDERIYVIGFSFPVVPKGKARIRVQISAAHSRDQINECINAFKKVGKKFGVIP